MKVGPKTLSFPGVGYPLLQTEPEVGPDWVKFVQSAGGRMGLRRRGGEREAVLPGRVGVGVDDLS